MRAVVYDEVRGTPTVREVARPSAPPGGAVVRVEASGLCRSDWHAWTGHEEVPLPNIPGHELAGVVVEVGASVSRHQVGDRVTVPFVEGCGVCEWCRSGNAQVCPNQQQPGFTHDGSFAEYVALYAADTNLVTLPDSVGFAAAAALGCRFATAYRGLVGRARLEADEWVLVVGAGGVGLSATMIAVALGARVIVLERSPAALDLAAGLGAAHTVLVDDAPAAERADLIVELTGGGAHVGVDAVGSEATAAESIYGLRRQGRHLQIGLMPSVHGHPRMPMERVIARELAILGCHGMAAADYPEMLGLIASGALDPGALVTRTIDLEGAARALPRMDTVSDPGITLVSPGAGQQG